MKKSRLFAVACVVATGMCGGALVAHADTEGDAGANTNLFTKPGFDDLLDADTDERDVTEWHINGSIKAKKEADGNVYLELSKSDNNAFLWSPLRTAEAGEYAVSFDVKHGEGWTGNSVFFGYRFWAGAETPDFCNVTAQMNAANADEWTHIETTYAVSAAMVEVVDSIQIGYDADGEGLNKLMVDNIVIEYIVPEAGAPEVVGAAIANWNENEPDDITFGVDLKGAELASVINKDTEEEYEEGYTYSADDNTITFDSDFCYDLGEGKHTIRLTTENGAIDLVINIYFAVPEIPSTTEGYDLKQTMLGGDFESYETGLKFSETQTEHAWGSVNLDDPGTIVDDNGNHVLRIGRAEGSIRQYSSAFCITSPDIQQGDIVTLKFSYKIVGDASTIGRNTNVVFVGASNTDYHGIDLLTKNEMTREGNENVTSYPIKYTEGENGYTDVEMSFIVDFSFMNATNSVRFLQQIGTGEAEIYFDNVQLIRWVEEGTEDAEVPTVTPATATYDGKNGADITLTVNLKDYNIAALKCDNIGLKVADYALSADDTTLTIKKEYLATLANGTHTFTIQTLGGTCEFTVTVSNEVTKPTTPAPNPKTNEGLGAGAIAGIVIGCVAGVALIGLGVFFLLKRKKNGKGKKEEKK